MRLAGVAEMEKSAGDEEFTTRVTVVEWTVAPLVPVMVIVDVPTGVVLAVVTVKVEEPDVVTDAGLNVAVAPVGNPLAVKVTVPAKPFRAVIVAVYVVLFPWTTVCEAGVAEMEKSGAGGGFTTRETVVE